MSTLAGVSYMTAVISVSPVARCLGDVVPVLVNEVLTLSVSLRDEYAPPMLQLTTHDQ